MDIRIVSERKNNYVCDCAWEKVTFGEISINYITSLHFRVFETAVNRLFVVIYSTVKEIFHQKKLTNDILNLVGGWGDSDYLGSCYIRNIYWMKCISHFPNWLLIIIGNYE